MCLIVDADSAHLLFSNPPHADAKPAWDWISHPKRNGHLVFGGENANEILGIEAATRALRELVRAGRATRVNPPELPKLLRKICRSNDKHIIALARESGARILYSHDQRLHVDFKNSKLIDGPRGTIYQFAKHRNLLKHSSSCGKL